MLNPFDTDQLIGNLFYHPDCPTNDQHFETVVGIKMNMQCRNNLIMICMLVVGQLIGEIPYVMVINQCHCADRLLIFRSATLLDQ